MLLIYVDLKSSVDSVDSKLIGVKAEVGLGSLAAAITAHDQGASCVVLEKADKLGGLSGFGGGEVFVPANEKMLELGLDDALRRIYHDNAARLLGLS